MTVDNERYVDLKEDFKETKKDVKDLSKSVVVIEKSMIASEATQKSILIILTDNKETLVRLTKDVEAKDLKYTQRMNAMDAEIKTIKELPYKNAMRVKWIFYATIVSAIGVTVTLLWDKVLKGLFKILIG